MWRMTILFAIVWFANGQRFHNPVLDNGDYPDPGVILYNGVYYAVTTTNNESPEKFPIHTSKDLQNWSQIGYVFNEANLPKWSRVKAEYWAPEIHQINGKFLVYYTSHDVENNVLAIGVAVGNSPAGPFTTPDKPILVFPDTWVADPTVINDPTNGKLMLSWVNGYNIRARNLTNDGLAFKDDTTVLLLKPDKDWEGGETEGPWYIYRNGYHYLFYSGNNFCGENYALGVARSRTSTGPYEKLPYPLLVSNNEFKGPGHGSIVRDTDGEGYVFVHHGWKTGAVCGSYPRLMFSTSMSWGADDWPRNMTIGD